MPLASPAADPDRLLIVVQGDARGRYVNFVRAGLTDDELARDIACGDGFDGRDQILFVNALIVGETRVSDITEDIAQALEKVSTRAVDERWGGFQECASGLLARCGRVDAWALAQDAKAILDLA